MFHYNVRLHVCTCLYVCAVRVAHVWVSYNIIMFGILLKYTHVESSS